MHHYFSPVLILASLFTFQSMAHADSVCQRSKSVVDALVNETHKSCDLITDQDLAKIFGLDIVVADEMSLQSSDLRGLTGMENILFRYNASTPFPEGMLKNLPALRELFITAKTYRVLTKNIYQGSSATDLTLEIEDANLSAFPIEIFSNISENTEIDFMDDQVTRLPAQFFQTIPQLGAVYLNLKNLAQLPDTLFHYTPNLKGVALRCPQVKILPENIFEGLSKLSFVDLSNNHFASIPEHLYYGISTIKTLALTNMKLSSLPENLFHKMYNVTRLYLGYNELTPLPDGIFRDLNKVELLSLPGSNFTTISNSVFSGKGFRKEAFVILDDNPIDAETKARLTDLLPKVRFK